MRSNVPTPRYNRKSWNYTFNFVLQFNPGPYTFGYLISIYFYIDSVANILQLLPLCHIAIKLRLYA